LAVQVNGVVKHMKVKPGDCSGCEFKYRLKRLFKLSDSTQLEVDFTVANPFSPSGDSVVLSGLESYGAAIHCGALMDWTEEDGCSAKKMSGDESAASSAGGTGASGIGNEESHGNDDAEAAALEGRHGGGAAGSDVLVHGRDRTLQRMRELRRQIRDFGGAASVDGSSDEDSNDSGDEYADESDDHGGRIAPAPRLGLAEILEEETAEAVAAAAVEELANRRRTARRRTSEDGHRNLYYISNCLLSGLCGGPRRKRRRQTNSRTVHPRLH